MKREGFDLKSMDCNNLTKGSRFLTVWGLAAGAMFLTSCSMTPEQDASGQAPVTKIEKKQKVEQAVSLSSGEMNATVMYQVLAAEMLVLKGFPADAFDVIYPLAKQTRDPQLAKRAFELSMSTYDENKIGLATGLWLETEPESPVPWRAAYLMSLRAGQLQQAIEQWQQYRQKSDQTLQDDILASVQRVARAAKAETALPFFDYLTTEHELVWQGWYGYGLLAEHYRQPEKAADFLEKALTVLSQEEEGQAERRIYQRLSKVYIQLDSPGRGLNRLGVYLKRQPEDWLVQERMARLEVKAERFVAAENRYQRILNANPGATTSRLSLALLQIEQGQVEAARKNLQKVSVESGYESVGFYYLGVLSQEQGELESALDYFDLVRADPYRVDAQLHKAEILFTLHGLERALQTLNQIKVGGQADQVKVFRAKAIFYRAAQKPDQSIEMYRRALDLDPDNIELLFAQSVLFYDTGRFKEYVHNLEQVLKQRPDEVDALNALGYFYVEQNTELKMAETLLKRALELAPNSYYVLDSMGWLAYRQQDYRRAADYLQRALAIQLDKEVLMHLITVQWKWDKKQQAKELWQKYLSQYANDPQYQSLIRRLEQGELD